MEINILDSSMFVYNRHLTTDKDTTRRMAVRASLHELKPKGLLETVGFNYKKRRKRFDIELDKNKRRIENELEILASDIEPVLAGYEEPNRAFIEKLPTGSDGFKLLEKYGFFNLKHNSPDTKQPQSIKTLRAEIGEDSRVLGILQSGEIYEISLENMFPRQSKHGVKGYGSRSTSFYRDEDAFWSLLTKKPYMLQGLAADDRSEFELRPQLRCKIRRIDPESCSDTIKAHFGESQQLAISEAINILKHKKKYEKVLD